MNEDLLEMLRIRFEKTEKLHPDMLWADVLPRLDDAKLAAVAWMEETGGEPTVATVLGDGDWVIVDSSKESPKGRCSLCYDDEALEKRKANKPAGSALGIAAAHGLSVLNESEYRRMQEFIEMDLKTSSWIQTDAAVRAIGGALFCDRRYGRVFTYHNGAESYYSGRGFRGYVRI